MTQLLHRPEIIVPDGFRSAEEALYFLDQPNTHLVAIVADDDETIDREIRFNRQEKRSRGAEDSPTWKAFLRDDNIEGAWIEPVIHLAREQGIVIINNGGLDDLEKNVMSGLRNILPN